MTLPGTDCHPPETPTPVQPATADQSDQRWAALVDHREAVVRIARQRGAGADAEDVAQEALLRAVNYAGLDLSRAKSFLAKVACNLVVDLQRRAARERALHGHASLTAAPAGVTEEVERVEERDLARHAGSLVARLHPDVRNILSRRSEGATWVQIGEELGQRQATVEMRYRRAIAPLRRQLSVS